ncbi:alginate O-acetyltransferase [Flavobacterium columnare]|nr:alginate O-acetyltransferase [Flavobacterium columnare]
MLFNSGFFVYFFLVFIICYYILRKNYLGRAYILSFFSLYFFYKASGNFVFLVIGSAVVDYLLSIAIYKARTKVVLKKVLLIVCIIFNLGLLFYFKYTNFFIEIINNLNITKLDPVHILLPVGISFYTFHGLSYVIDIYKKRIKAEYNFIDYSLFVSYFPLLVAGPIERATHLLPQVKVKREFNFEKAKEGTYQIIWGLVKKIVVADSCALYANAIFDHSHTMNSYSLVLGAIYFAFQIYGDFSGYSDIALGTSKLFGIDLLKNFNYPYFSRDIAEFWRRWHISLSSWFRDYLYIPLGGSQGGKWMQVRNTFIIFLVSGFWHGANWTFIIWGLINGFGLIFNKYWTNITSKINILPKFISKLIFGLITFHFVCFCWIFFKAENLETSLTFINQIINQFSLEGAEEFIVNYKQPLIMIAIGYLIHLIPNNWSEKYIKIQTKLPLLFNIIVMILFIFLYSYFKSSESVMPIYLQF